MAQWNNQKLVFGLNTDSSSSWTSLNRQNNCNGQPPNDYIVYWIQVEKKKVEKIFKLSGKVCRPDFYNQSLHFSIIINCLLWLKEDLINKKSLGIIKWEFYSKKNVNIKYICVSMCNSSQYY